MTMTKTEALRILIARLGADELPARTYPIRPPELMPGVVPLKASAPVLAADSPAYTFAAGAGVAAGFPGYQYLSMLATRAEYRAFASAMSTELTREWVELTSSDTDGGDTPEKIASIEEEMERLDVRGAFQRAAEHDCFFGRGQFFLDVDGADRSTPLIMDSRTIRRGSLVGVRTVEAIWTTPAAYDAIDPASPSFYKPSAWFMLGQHVHASRLLTVITRPLPDMLKPAFNFSGMSLSQLAEPYVDNWLRTRQAVADLIDNFSVTGLKTSMDQILQGVDEEGAALIARAELFTKLRSNKGLMLLDKENEELVQLNVPLSGLETLQAQSQEHMCLRAGTQVLTRRGSVAIEDVTSVDFVLTRKGYAPVEWAGITGSSDTFVVIETSAGEMHLTEDHPVWLESKNAFVPARDVSRSDLLSKSLEMESMGNPYRGAGTCGAVQNAGITETQKPEDSCIESFTKRMLGRFRKALMFITETKTPGTTLWKISKLFHALSILPSTSRKDGDDCSVGASKCAASIANRTFSRHGLSAQNTVARSAEPPRTKREAVRAVRSVSTRRSEPVYNLKVADGFPSEFFAEGILVHNCSVSHMPAIVLTGISPTGLNASSEGELQTWEKWVAAQQVAFWLDPLRTIINCIQLSLFGEIDPAIGIKFKPLRAVSAKEAAEIRAADGVTACGYIDRGVLSPNAVREKLARDPDSGYQGLDLEEDALPEMTEDESVSEAQRRAMQAAAHGHSTLGIPESVGEEFVAKDA